jgi:hypothetical protein
MDKKYIKNTADALFGAIIACVFVAAAWSPVRALGDAEIELGNHSDFVIDFAAPDEFLTYVVVVSGIGYFDEDVNHEDPVSIYIEFEIDMATGHCWVSDFSSQIQHSVSGTATTLSIANLPSGEYSLYCGDVWKTGHGWMEVNNNHFTVIPD